MSALEQFKNSPTMRSTKIAYFQYSVRDPFTAPW